MLQMMLKATTGSLKSTKQLNTRHRRGWPDILMQKIEDESTDTSQFIVKIGHSTKLFQHFWTKLKITHEPQFTSDQKNCTNFV